MLAKSSSESRVTRIWSRLEISDVLAKNDESKHFTKIQAEDDFIFTDYVIRIV